MKCSYCGKEIPNDAARCKYCAEPTHNYISQDDREWKAIELERKARNRAATNTNVFSIGIVVAILSPLVLTFPMLLFSDKIKISTYVIATIIIAVLTCTIIPTVCFFYARKRIPEESIVKWKQYITDKTSICPACGSHSVKLYRKGYDWNEAFIGSALNMDELKYTAGMDANRTMCFCSNCGHKWKTHYDYRTL